MMKPVQFKKGEFEIYLKLGKKEMVKGYKGEHFGIHKTDQGDWIITHLASGYSVGNCDKLKDAKERISVFISSGIDWSRTNLHTCVLEYHKCRHANMA